MEEWVRLAQHHWQFLRFQIHCAMKDDQHGLHGCSSRRKRIHHELAGHSWKPVFPYVADFFKKADDEFLTEDEDEGVREDSHLSSRRFNEDEDECHQPPGDERCRMKASRMAAIKDR